MENKEQNRNDSIQNDTPKLAWETPQLSQIETEDTESGIGASVIEDNPCCLASF